MVPNVPLAADAVAGLTGGQFCAHAPLHFDVVEVSGANEYSVNPLALASTVALPILAVFRPAAAAACALLASRLLAREAAEGVPDEAAGRHDRPRRLPRRRSRASSIRRRRLGCFARGR